MRKFTQVLLIALVAFFAGYGMRRTSVAAAGTGTRKPLYYRDPMHPAYRSDKPGIAPDCGMKLEPVYEDTPPSGSAAPDTATGAVQIGAREQQLAGIRTVQATRGSAAHTIRVNGRVIANENRTYQVVAFADGVVRSVSAYVPGSVVQKSDLLATYFVYNRDIYTAIQSYFIAMNAKDQATSILPASVIDTSDAQVRLNEELLESYGITQAQIRQLATTRKATRDVQFRSPITGVVLSLNAYPGQKVDRGTELYRIADLGRVSVLADIFDADASALKPGVMVHIRSGARNWTASTTDIRQPDPSTRAMQVRFEVSNADLALRPNAFVDVELTVHAPASISVPADALIDGGQRKTVFIAKNDGRFEPREVTTGARFADRVEITSGLAEGERVVTAGLFLLDSESRLRTPAPAEPRGASVSGITDAVCGMTIAPESAHAWDLAYHGSTYHFCSKLCRQKFENDPAKYTHTRPESTGSKS